MLPVILKSKPKIKQPQDAGRVLAPARRPPATRSQVREGCAHQLGPWGLSSAYLFRLGPEPPPAPGPGTVQRRAAVSFNVARFPNGEAELSGVFFQQRHSAS